MLWEKFLKSGSIVDYLKYKASEEAKDNDNAEGPDNPGGDPRREQ